MTVQVLDANDALVTESSAPILLSLAPAGPILRGIDPVNAVNGIATFTDLTINQVVGAFTLQARQPRPRSRGEHAVQDAACSVDHHREQSNQAVRDDLHLHRHGIHRQRSACPATRSPRFPSPAWARRQPPPCPAARTRSFPFGADGPGLANYDITYVDGAMTVTPAALTITAKDQTKAYGTTFAFAGTEFTVNGLLGTDAVTSVTLTSAGAPATAPVSGSPYAITPSAAVGTGLANYTIAYINGALTVTTATLTITATDKTKVYGTAFTFIGSEFTTTGLAPGDTVTSVTLVSPGALATASVAGSPYPITPSAAVGTGLANYTISYVDGALTVTRATLAINATDQTKPYGAAFTFTGTEFTTSGLAPGDTVTAVTLVSPGAPATALASGSPYPIIPSAAVGTGLANYDISYVNGAMTVTPAALTITATGQTKAYGTAFTFSGTEFTVSGLVGTDAVTSVTLTSAGAAATAPVSGSPYAIIPSAAVGTGLANYTITYVDGALTVTPASLTITATGQTKAYGTAFTFSGTEFTVSALAPGDAVTSVTLISAGAPATASVAGSPYPITPSAAVGTGLANYTITYVDGALTVTPAAVDDHRVRPDEGLRHHIRLHRDRVHRKRSRRHRCGDVGDADELRRSGDGPGFRQPVSHHRIGRGRHGSRQLHDRLRQRGGDRDPGHPDDHRHGPDEGLRDDVDVHRYRVQRHRPPGHRCRDLGDADELRRCGHRPGVRQPVLHHPVGGGRHRRRELHDHVRRWGADRHGRVADDHRIRPDEGLRRRRSRSQAPSSPSTGLVNGDTVDSATITSAGAPAAAAPGTYPIDISAAVGSGLANYTITYVPGTMTVGNTPPTVGDAAVSTNATNAVSGTVAVNDPDAGQTVTLTISSAPSNGTAIVAQDGSFTYTPTGTFTGRDTFNDRRLRWRPRPGLRDRHGHRDRLSGRRGRCGCDERGPDHRGGRPGERHRGCRRSADRDSDQPTGRHPSVRSSTRRMRASAVRTMWSTASAARMTRQFAMTPR